MPPTKPPTKKPMTKPVVRTKSPIKARTVKTFSVKPSTSEGRGEKILIYGFSGIGKTSLGSTAPKPVYLDIDSGSQKIISPVTGKPVNAVVGLETFQDACDALAQTSLFADAESIIIDTGTKLEGWMQQHILDTIPLPGGGHATSFLKFGWDGDRHILDMHRLFLALLDKHVDAGRNVIIMAQQGQIKRSNAESTDYLEDGPYFRHRNDCSSREEIKQWADHVFRIGYLNMTVTLEKGAKAGKVTSTDNTRVIFTDGAQHFTAKSRPINGVRIPAIVSFEDESDDSLWQYLFEGAVEATTETGD